VNQEFILGKLGEIMGWDTQRSREEFAWLGLMAKMKYDGYEDFRAGARFVESLADWLQQFTQADREAAYAFIRRHLTYVGPAEMNHLVELFFPETVQWRLMRAAADRCGVPPYRVWAETNATECYRRLLRQTLFIELSDGARIDVFRRANSEVISNEQVVTAPRIIRAKWDGLLGDLRRSLKDPPEARFAFVFLVDDFIASGTTLLRWEEKKGEWNGKLARFWTDLEEARVIGTHFEPDWILCVHHYLATHRGTQAAEQRHAEALEFCRRNGKGWFERVKFSYGMILGDDFPVDQARHHEFLELVRTYYDDSIETEHTRLGGEDMRLGFGKCGLPLVLTHNTPNNAIALLWAETAGKDGKHAMRPLFRRRQRHT
jgi:hypothetical protein